MLSRSCAPVADARAVAEDDRAHQTHARADLHVAPDPGRALDLGVLAAAARSPATITPGASSAPSSSRCSSPASASKVPWRSSPSEPTSFQYSLDLVDVEGHVVLEQRREHVLGPVHERALGEVVEDPRVEQVDAAVAEVRQRLLGRRLLLKAGDAPVAVVQHDAVLARVGDPLDGQRGDPAGLAVAGGERASGRCR